MHSFLAVFAIFPALHVSQAVLEAAEICPSGHSSCWEGVGHLYLVESWKIERG